MSLNVKRSQLAIAPPQVRYNTETQTLASSGVEKAVKLWSPFRYPGWRGQIEDESPHSATRQLYSRNDYINLVLQR